VETYRVRFALFSGRCECTQNLCNLPVWSETGPGTGPGPNKSGLRAGAGGDMPSSVPDFDPTDPFPHWPDYGPPLYAAAKRHAAAADAWLGLRVEETEALLRDPQDGEERWIGRHSSIFLTPYIELRHWLAQLKPTAGDTIADLGAGYGRLGFVLARHFPAARFEGFELVPERARAGAEALARYPAPNAKLTQADIAAPGWTLPAAAVYFVYDFGSRESIARVLEKLRAAARDRGVRVVARGRGMRGQIERDHPWLGSVHEPIHGAHYSIYRSFE